MKDDEILKNYRDSLDKWDDIAKALGVVSNTIFLIRERITSRCGFCEVTHNPTQEADYYILQPCIGCPLWDDEESDTCALEWEMATALVHEAETLLNRGIKQAVALHARISKVIHEMEKIPGQMEL